MADQFVFAVMLLSSGLLLYAWLAYPVILQLTVRLKAGKSAGEGTGCHRPRYWIVFAAHNEEAWIGRRLENIMRAAAAAADSDLCGIHAGLDACTDRTAAIAAGFARDHDVLHIHDFAERRGKTPVIKQLVMMVRAQPGASDDDVIILTDANTMFREDTISGLLKPFSDPAVGGVCGRLALHKTSGGQEAESAYWRMENRLKKMESRLDSCLGANGAVYAVRSGCFPADLPGNTVVDDFVIGMKVREGGRRMVFTESAVADEELPESRHEWPRRVRIGMGDYQALGICRRCLSPAYGCFAWMFWSHKVLRWFTPHLALLVAVTAILTVAGPGGWQGMQAAAAFMVLAAGFVFSSAALLPGAAGRAVRHFIIMQAAMFAGFLRYIGRGVSGIWERTPR